MPTEPKPTPTWRDIIPPATMASLAVYTPVYNRETGLKGVVTELCPDEYAHAPDDYIVVFVREGSDTRGGRTYAWHPALVSFDLDDPGGFGGALRCCVRQGKGMFAGTLGWEPAWLAIAVENHLLGETTESDKLNLAEAIAALEAK